MEKLEPLYTVGWKSNRAVSMENSTQEFYNIKTK